MDQSMTLSFVDLHLQNLNNLDNAVLNLAVGITKCMGTQPTQGPLKNALWRIKQYWKLCQYQTGANVFLRLRDVLNLKGDFEIVKRLSQQVGRAHVYFVYRCVCILLYFSLPNP